MSKTLFTDEQIAVFKTNPYTDYVSAKTLCFKKEFKAIFYAELQNGKTARKILDDHGYPSSYFNRDRINGIVEYIRKEAARNEGFRDRSDLNANRLNRDKVPKEPLAPSIEQLQTEVTYLRQEVEFLKKIFLTKGTEK